MNNQKKKIGKYVINMGNRLGIGAYSEVYVGIDEDSK